MTEIDRLRAQAADVARRISRAEPAPAPADVEPEPDARARWSALVTANASSERPRTLAELRADFGPVPAPGPRVLTRAQIAARTNAAKAAAHLAARHAKIATDRAARARAAGHAASP